MQLRGFATSAADNGPIPRVPSVRGNSYPRKNKNRGIPHSDKQSAYRLNDDR